MARTSVIGGEAGHRGFFGGSASSGRTTAIVIAFIAWVAMASTMGLFGTIAGGVLLLAAWFGTMPTRRGSLAERWLRGKRWRERRKLGTYRYEPYSQERWDEYVQMYRSKDRQARREAMRGLNTLRETPDGADGMGWLQSEARRPGIAWHAPAGEESYLSVAFSVSGQVRGLENQGSSDLAAELWGRFQARLGREDSLAKSVQTVTRVLPPDSARHQAWAARNVDPNVAEGILRSYDELIRLADRSAMGQRHFVVLRWPLTSDFRSEAARYGEGRQGWRALMAEEIEETAAALRAVGHQEVAPLTARQLAAVIRHMQDPHLPIDQVRNVDANAFGLASEDVYSAHVVPTVDPITGQEQEWWHRTAVIRAENLAVTPRSSMWLAPLLSGSNQTVRRTLAFQQWLVPAWAARKAARKDMVRDISDNTSNAEAGKLLDDQTTVNLSAAQQRAADLRPGQQVSGGEWVGFVTISALGAHELAKACRQTESVAANDLGIEKLEWLDTYAAAASGTTWPIARGIRPPKVRTAHRAMSLMTGKKHKEEL